jgi:hypothetical protein
MPAVAILLARAAAGDGSPAAASRCAALALVSVAAVLGVKFAASHWETSRDMRRLATLVDDVDRDAEVLIYRSANLHGLEFYRDGRVRRVSNSGKQEWADLDLDSAIAALVEPDDGLQLLVAGERDVGEVQDRLRALGVPFRSVQETKWVVLEPRVLAGRPIPH